jgi:hypothetical protein
MLRKNPGCFTDWQLRQLETIDSRLVKLDCEAYAILRRAKDLNLNIRQWRHVGDLLGMIAIRMTFALRYRQEILSAGRHRTYEKIVLHLGTHEYPDEQPPKPHDGEDETRDEGDEKNSKNQAQVQMLLVLANQVEEIISVRSTFRNVTLGVFFGQLNRLKIALLKQLKDLKERVQAHIPKIEIITDYEEPIDEDDYERVK